MDNADNLYMENVRFGIELSGIYSKLLTVIAMSQDEAYSQSDVFVELVSLASEVQEAIGELRLTNEMDYSSSLAAENE